LAISAIFPSIQSACGAVDEIHPAAVGKSLVPISPIQDLNGEMLDVNRQRTRSVTRSSSQPAGLDAAGANPGT
jgi:hypothetical protein